MWPLMNSEVILHIIKSLRSDNVSIHRNLDQNRFINECARKKFGYNPGMNDGNNAVFI